jgi:hypothetical protein
MAELSEDDRRKILGDRYKEIEESAQKKGGARLEDQVKAIRSSKAESQKLNAFAIGIVGLILLVSNFYAVSGPSLMLVTAIALGLCAAGGAWYARQIFVLRQLR